MLDSVFPAAAVGSLHAAETALGHYVLGQPGAVRLLLATILAGGHALLVGPPGVAKTTLVEAAAAVLDLGHKRIQGTPDLLPGDILGAEILDTNANGVRHFRFLEGPVFTNLLLFDEINRASPRTQAALLQAMQEHTVAVAGESRPLPKPFHVLAAQNPLDFEGTYPLPEVQLDRFMTAISLGYTDEHEEKAILISTTTAPRSRLTPRLDGESLKALQSALCRAPIGDALVALIVSILRQTRPDTTTLPIVREHVRLGASPRAGQAFMMLSRALALLDNRPAPSPDDLRTLAPAILGHRLVLAPTALAAGVTAQQVVEAVVKAALP